MGSAPSVEIHTEAGVGQRTFGASPDRVWAVLPEVFERLEIPVNRRDRQVPEMGNSGFAVRRIEDKRMSAYVDCGTTLAGRLADVHDVTLMVIVRLAATSDGGTTVTTFVDATAKSRSTSGNPIHCQSNGALERRVSDVVAERLVAALGTR
jgi:hypothetical protein